jgi:hypothetical protein
MGPVVAALWADENYDRPFPSPRALGERELNTIGYTLSRYGALTGEDLEVLSHTRIRGGPPTRDDHRAWASSSSTSSNRHQDKSAGMVLLGELPFGRRGTPFREAI